MNTSTGTPRSTSPAAGLTPTVGRRRSSSPTTSTYGHLLQLRRPDPLAERLVGVDEVGAAPAPRSRPATTSAYSSCAVGDRQDAHLHRREPRRERAGVVLEQHPEESLDRAEQGAVQHDRAVAVVVGADVLELEALGVVEVELDRRRAATYARSRRARRCRSSGRRTPRRPPSRRTRGRAGRGRVRSASVAVSQIASLPTYFFGSFVERLNVKSSNPNARSTDSTKSSSDAISSAAARACRRCGCRPA